MENEEWKSSVEANNSCNFNLILWFSESLKTNMYSILMSQV